MDLRIPTKRVASEEASKRPKKQRQTKKCWHDDSDEDCKPFELDDSSEEDTKKRNIPLGRLHKVKKTKAIEDPEASNKELVKTNDTKIRKLEEEIDNLRSEWKTLKHAVLVQHTKQAKKIEGESIHNFLSHVEKKGHGARVLWSEILVTAVGKLTGEQVEELTKAMQEE